MAKSLKRVHVEPGKRYRGNVEIVGFGLWVTDSFLRAALEGLGAADIDICDGARPGRVVVTLTWRKEARWFELPIGARLLDFREVTQ